MQIQAALHHRVCSTRDTYNDATNDVVTVQYSSLTKQPSTAAGQGDTCQIMHCIAEKSLTLPILQYSAAQATFPMLRDSPCMHFHA